MPDLSADRFMMRSYCRPRGCGSYTITKELVTGRSQVYISLCTCMWGGECRLFKKIIMLMVIRVVVDQTSSPAIKPGLC